MRKNELCLNVRRTPKDILDVIVNDMGSAWHGNEEGWCFHGEDKQKIIDIYAKYGRRSARDRLIHGVCFELYAELKPYLRPPKPTKKWSKYGNQ